MAPDGTIVCARFAPGGALEVRERPPGGPIGATTIVLAKNLRYPSEYVLATTKWLATDIVTYLWNCATLGVWLLAATTANGEHRGARVLVPRRA